MALNADRLRELINAELDGELAPSARAELDAGLAALPGLQAERAALQRLAAVLDAIGEVEPPADLVGRILARIPVRPGAVQRPGRAFRPRLLFPFAAFATGICATIAVLVLVPGQDLSPDTGALSGALVRGLVPEEPVEPAARVVDLGAGLGQLRVASSSPDSRTLAFALEGTDAVEITLDLAGSGLAFDAIDPADAGIVATGGEDGPLRLRSPGSRSFSVRLGVRPAAAQPGPIGLSIARQGTVLLERRVEAP